MNIIFTLAKTNTEKSTDKINVCSLAEDNEHKVDFTNLVLVASFVIHNNGDMRIWNENKVCEPSHR